uniref:Glucose-methanol-choline (GMC) oxidoreductase:NAD binding site n=1 Tax=uncultured bacterium A1Q1_fos_1880 TaxID=1256556 RepID=L7VR99_9BACT|nr:glucose-methanol-choline (GMC) oxidoreductase:NAD binding site [uncultured bacterium A1Q1_fos_1880]
MAEPIRTQVVIVGAGVAGMLVAYRLAQAGVQVVVLEAGPPVNRAEALATYRTALIKVPEAPYPDTPYAPRPTVADLEGYYVQEGPTLFKSTYVRRVGGTTWHWLGTSLRHLPADFQLQSRYGVAVDWPLTYAQLEPWYGAAERELGVAGDGKQDLGSPRTGEFPMQPLPLTYLDKQIALAAAKLGYTVHLTPQARNSVTYDGRPPCCGSSSCVPICPIGAKYDATVHVRKAQALGVQVIDQAVVHFIEVDSAGQVTGIRFKRPDGSEERAEASIYVLAAHAIETPKLLLMSRTDALPNGVANSSDQVGRNLMDHPVQLSWALAKEPVYPYRSPLENAGIEDFRDGDFRRERAAFRMAIGEDGWSFPGTTPTALAPELVKQGLRGEALVAELNRQVARQFRFANLIEQLPDPENRIVPAFDHLDALGLPRPRITYQLGEFVERGMAEARRVSEQIFQAMGATAIQHSEEHEGAGHVMGTYRMGNDPKTSVVTADQRCHDHPNLFLVGSGVFPTVGTANPTLTIAALALRAAETIKAELTGGVT